MQICRINLCVNFGWSPDFSLSKYLFVVDWDCYNIDRYDAVFLKSKGGITILKIGIIVGSNRKNRISDQIGDFVLDVSREVEIDDAEFEIVDLIDYDL